MFDSLPIAQLLAVDQSSALYNEGERRSIFYAEAWVLTHYLLLERPDGASMVNTYGSNQKTTTACGTRTPPDTVYLTRRSADAAQRAAGIVGTTVAGEFVPRDYIP